MTGASETLHRKNPAVRHAWLLAVGLLLFTAGPAEAFVIVNTADGDFVHWDLRCVGVWLHPTTVAEVAPSEAEAALERAMATWNAVDCAYVKLQARGATCFDDVGLSDWPGPQNVLSWHDGPGAWPHTEPVVALTSITYDPTDGALVDADIEVNGSHYFFSHSEAGEANAYDLEQTLTHELGHLLGLDHSPVRDATMFTSSVAGELSKRSLDDDDIEAICTNHAMRDSPPTPPCQADAVGAPIAEPWCPEAPPAEDCAGGGDSALSWVIALIAGLGWRCIRRRQPHTVQRC